MDRLGPISIFRMLGNIVGSSAHYCHLADLSRAIEVNGGERNKLRNIFELRTDINYTTLYFAIRQP